MPILLSKEQLNNIYLFDGTITETMKAFFQVYQFKVPPQNQIEQLTELIRNNVIEIIDEEEKFYLDTYCNNAIYYTRFLIHSLALFSKGYETVREFYDLDEYIEASEKLSPKFIERAAKILIKALHDYYFDVMEFITTGTLKPDNLNYLVRFIAGDGLGLWKDRELGSEKLLLLLIHGKSYGFAKFIATYLAILNNEPVRVRGDAAKSPVEQFADWVHNIDRGN